MINETDITETIPTTESAMAVKPHFSNPKGTIGNNHLISPKVPIFSMTPASTTDPGVGASTWASGNQVCSGKIGTLIAKAKANAKNSKRAGGAN